MLERSRLGLVDGHRHAGARRGLRDAGAHEPTAHDTDPLHVCHGRHPNRPSASAVRSLRHRMWWQEAVVYQIYPRSFADTDGDGVGDLDGIARAPRPSRRGSASTRSGCRRSIRSPMADFGYDVADYCDVDPLFGDARRLRRAARRRARARHPRHARLGAQPHLRPAPVVRRVARRRDDARSATGTSGATARRRRAAQQLASRPSAAGPRGRWDEATGQWYLHLFLPEQPDLNWDNPEVRRRPCTTCCASGSTAASTASASTSCTSSARTPRCPTSRDQIVGSHLDVVAHATTTTARTRCCAGSGACSTTTPATA